MTPTALPPSVRMQIERVMKQLPHLEAGHDVYIFEDCYGRMVVLTDEDNLAEAFSGGGRLMCFWSSRTVALSDRIHSEAFWYGVGRA